MAGETVGITENSDIMSACVFDTSAEAVKPAIPTEAKLSKIRDRRKVIEKPLERIILKGKIDKVRRFDADADSRRNCYPSFSFDHPEERENGMDVEEWTGKPSSDEANSTHLRKLVPRFVKSVTDDGRDMSIVEIRFPTGTDFYGTGEVPAPLRRNNRKIISWNTDSFCYNSNTEFLYNSHPYLLCLLPDGSCVGILADTACACEINLQRKRNSLFLTSIGSFPVIFFGPFLSPQEVTRALAVAVGKMPMPPLWALGYQQCRFSYEPDEQVKKIAKTFRDKSLPLDAIWMVSEIRSSPSPLIYNMRYPLPSSLQQDIDYMDGYRCFTFDKKKFPEPKKLNQWLRDIHVKSIYMLDPGIKLDDDYSVYKEGCSKDVWVKTSTGKENAVGKVWPGDCVFPDFTMHKTRDWWAKMVTQFMDEHEIDGLWNDMNEPAILDAETKTLPLQCLHRPDASMLKGHLPSKTGDGASKTESGSDGEGASECCRHEYYHNVYGMLMVKASREGIKKAYNGSRRPFVLSRANFIGGHRYAAVWTGDNVSNVEHLRHSLPMVINLGISGQPFSGPDIGGFAGDCIPRMFGRWMGIGCLLPFSRAHSIKDSAPHEPWSFGEEVEEVCRQALRRRYRFLPHLYTLFYKSSIYGDPVAMPTFYFSSRSKELRRDSASFLLGEGLFVSCIHLLQDDYEDKTISRISEKEKKQTSGKRKARTEDGDLDTEGVGKKAKDGGKKTKKNEEGEEEEMDEEKEEILQKMKGNTKEKAAKQKEKMQQKKREREGDSAEARQKRRRAEERIKKVKSMDFAPPLPPGVWSMVSLFAEENLRDLPRLFIRDGFGFPTREPKQSTTEFKSTDTITLVFGIINPWESAVNKDPSLPLATCELYDDAGEGRAFEDGQYLFSTYTLTLEGRSTTASGDAVVAGGAKKGSYHERKLRVTVAKSDGKMQRPKRTLCVKVIVIAQAQGGEVDGVQSPCEKVIQQEGNDGEDIILTWTEFETKN